MIPPKLLDRHTYKGEDDKTVTHNGYGEKNCTFCGQDYIVARKNLGMSHDCGRKKCTERAIRNNLRKEKNG